jgi:dolichol-phosphate mannosyltransferase
MDADCSHSPEVIDAMAASIEGCDLVIGSRYVEHGKIVDFQFWRILLSKGGNALAKVLLGLKTHDCTSGYRCYRSKMLSVIDLEKVILARRYIFLVELLFYLSRHGCRIKEVPIVFVNRVEGKTKVNFKEMSAGLWTIVKLSITKRLFRRP